MKRNKLTKSSAGKSLALDARRLTIIRGGDGLGIAVEVNMPPPPEMRLQHNETLVS